MSAWTQSSTSASGTANHQFQIQQNELFSYKQQDQWHWTMSYLTFLAVSWPRWAWLWQVTRRKFCPVFRACRPRGHMSKYNIYSYNTQWNGTKTAEKKKTGKSERAGKVLSRTLNHNETERSWTLDSFTLLPFHHSDLLWWNTTCSSARESEQPGHPQQWASGKRLISNGPIEGVTDHFTLFVLCKKKNF